MDSLAGVKLIKADGSSQTAEDALANKEIVLYYFSAHWCPPCRGFTPMLKDFYEEVSDDGVEIVFVSSDRDVESMVNYMKEFHGDWFGVELNSTVANKLKSLYDISGIPSLIVCKKDGTLITKDGRGQVQGKAPKDVVKAWKK